MLAEGALSGWFGCRRNPASGAEGGGGGKRREGGGAWSGLRGEGRRRARRPASQGRAGSVRWEHPGTHAGFPRVGQGMEPLPPSHPRAPRESVELSGQSC